MRRSASPSSWRAPSSPIRSRPTCRRCATPSSSSWRRSPPRDLLGRAGKEELAEEIMREAVRPMGIEILAPEPVTHGRWRSAWAALKSAPRTKRPSGRRRRRGGPRCAIRCSTCISRASSSSEAERSPRHPITRSATSSTGDLMATDNTAAAPGNPRERRRLGRPVESRSETASELQGPADQVSPASFTNFQPTRAGWPATTSTCPRHPGAAHGRARPGADPDQEHPAAGAGLGGRARRAGRRADGRARQRIPDRPRRGGRGQRQVRHPPHRHRHAERAHAPPERAPDGTMSPTPG